MPRKSMLLVLALGQAMAACGGEAALRDVAVEATADRSERSLAELTRDAADPSSELAESAIAALRTRGPEGHAALFNTYAAEIATLREGQAAGARGERIRHAIDIVSGQRDGHASGLYWYTDLHEAERVAQETHRPILSLRLLGRLDEEMSCANSRYFRTVLYSNAELSDYLREHYVLHWSSERPVPRVTIDMGDGRRLERTLTGNSIHYVLDAEGQVIDAIPGLNAPSDFLEFARNAESAHRAGEVARPILHQGTLLRLTQMRERMQLAAPMVAGAAPSAIEAMPLTVGKMFVEAPILNALRAPAAPPVALDQVDWRSAAVEIFQRRPETVFDARSRALLVLKTGQEGPALEATMTALSLSVVADSVKNDATLRWSIGQLFAEADTAQTALDFEAMNTRVYAEVFLTPASDPWLGLQHADVWDAIERLH
jgi:hypothetical protein